MTGFQKFIYIWLIFCVGGVGSLTYFDGFMPGHEHGDHPYHWTVFEEAGHFHPPLPEPAAEPAHVMLLSQLDPHLARITPIHSVAPGFSRFFTSGLSKGYILTPADPKDFNLPACLGLVRLTALKGQSALLAPPEKPPSIQLG